MVAGIVLVSVTALLAVSVLTALIALAEWVADRLDRRNRNIAHLTPEQRAILHALEEQPR